MNKVKIAIKIIIFLFFVFSANAQKLVFDSLANELNIISGYQKSKSLEVLDKLYQMAYLDSDSSLRLARCLYEESLFKYRNGIVDTMLSKILKKRVSMKRLPIWEHALLQSALGINFLATGEYSSAFTTQLEALVKCKQLQDNRFTARTLNSLGNTCSAIGLGSLAEYYYLDAISHLTPDSYEYYLIKSNIFRMLSFKNKEAAVDSMLCLIEIAEKENRTDILPLMYINISSYLLEYSPEIALLYLTKCYSLDFENPYYTSLLYGNLANYYRITKDYQQALKYYGITRKVMEESNRIENLANLYHFLSCIFEEQNMLDSALYYAKKYGEKTKEHLVNTNAIETHQKYITTFLEAAQKDLVIAAHKIELKNRRFAVIVIVSIFTILLILTFLLYINQQKRRKISENRELTTKLEYEKRVQKLEKEKQEELLDAKTREIASYSALVSNKNHIFKQIMTLSAYVLNNREDTKMALTKIEEIIRGNLDTDKEWNNFKIHFEKVHPNFFEKLKKYSGDLTEENLKMCAYDKMGISTKQIAQLLNIAYNSVVVSRVRIKKKLQLEENVSLTDFIRNL